MYMDGFYSIKNNIWDEDCLLLGDVKLFRYNLLFAII